MSTAVKRACDACHRRKVKCDGINPCRNCSSAQLTCTYNAIPQKKGPKGSRAKVISELRETQRQTSLSAKVQSRLNGLGSPSCVSPSLAPTPGLLAPELVKEAVEFFFANMYSIMPIINRQRLEQQCMYIDQNPDTYCLITALSGYMMFQPGMSLPTGDPMLEHMPGAHIVSGTLLIEEAIRVRKGIDYMETPTLNTLCTSYFLFCSYYALEMHEKAWFYLREATTLAHMCGMTKEESYLQFDNVESSRRRRLYWLLFVTERAYALQRGRPLTLQASINLPSISDDPSDPLAHQLSGYISLVSIFRPFDDMFITLWNKTRGECSSSYLIVLRKQFSETSMINGRDIDQRLIQQWLKPAVWQLNMQHGCIPQNGQEQLHYQMDMSRELISLTSQFQTQSTELLGVPLVAKLLDIACALTDVLAMQPAPSDPFAMGPREHLNSLLQILSSLRNGDHHFLPLLLDKVHDILPRLANPMLQRAPDNVCLSNIDIFDGFGNAGMAQPPILTDFKTEPYTSNGVPHLQDIPAIDSSSPNGGSDLKSPYAIGRSPSVMSPNGEYAPSNEFNPMPEMMITSMGQSQQQSAIGQPGAMNAQQPHQQHSLHGMVSPNVNHNHPMNGQMSVEMHNNLPNGLNQAQNYVNIGQPQNQAYNQPAHSMMNNIMHRTPPQRTNSFMIHQHQHQSTQIPRTVGDFHALQRAGAENVSMNSMSLRQMQPELDFSNLP
ncbi:hypothetical protein F5B22DRAFT_110494 [Xylaria bambusicola]|uniref:uncharacterized protein n=1 Tax=Xylaria bambusicola TaxID=326684 RepID=UPI002007481E|nr:uncharacterized protein F5B22DRAFT_110494 [Xylaria bambusicola]KAI0517586.1 hypothetical protein F5B22DRAFT_110494 [Xylaria bambusicola]